jgi:ABC-type nitrate/sulfonate/bicarbonate transport system substrate-binding protein
MPTPQPRHLYLVAAIFACTFVSHAAAAASKLNVGNSSAPAFNFLPLALGLQQGIYAKNGVDVTEIDLGGSAKLHQAMTAGAIDLGLGAGTDVAFLVKGAPEIGVGAIAITPALFGAIVPYDSPVHSLADLKGKRVGISTVGSLTQWLAYQIAKKEGWDPNSFTYITDGSDYTSQLAAFETGAIDVQISGVVLGWNLEVQKKGRLLAPASDWVGPFLQNVIFASNDIVQKDPAAVRGFLKGWYDTVAWIGSHKAETIAYAATRDRFSTDIEEKQYDTVMPSFSTDGKFTAAAVKPVESSFVELNILPTEPDMSKYLTERYLPGAK